MKRLRLILGACALLAIAPVVGAEPAPGSISLEREVSVTLDRGDYRPKPLDDRTPLILRLETVTPAADGRFTYVFRYLGFEPGPYKLADYLVHPDGSPASDLGETPIQVDSILPPTHQGELNPFATQPFPWIGGYRRILGGLALLWLCGLPALIWLGRKKPEVPVTEVEVPALTYAERMRPLVEAAAAGQLTATGQANLERLLTGYWREKIARPDLRMSEALAMLKNHAEAGPLLRALERWLHRPGGATRAEIEGLLKPYRQPVVATGNEVEA